MQYDSIVSGKLGYHIVHDYLNLVVVSECMYLLSVCLITVAAYLMSNERSPP